MGARCKKERAANPYCQIKTNVRTYRVYDVYLVNEISEPSCYTGLVSLLYHAEKDSDHVIIHINSPGGRLSTAIMLYNAIKSSNARVTTIIEGEAHSAAGLIFLAGDRLVVQPFAQMLCHYYSGGVVGKGNEIESSNEFYKDHWKKVFSLCYHGFLNERELKQMFNGKDFYFNAEQIINRVKKMAKIRQADVEISTEDD